MGVVVQTEIDLVAGTAWIRSRERESGRVIQQFTLSPNGRVLMSATPARMVLDRKAAVSTITDTKAWIAQVTLAFGLEYQESDIRDIDLHFAERNDAPHPERSFRTQLTIGDLAVADATLYPHRDEVHVEPHPELDLAWSEFVLATQYVRMAVEPSLLLKSVPLLMALRPV